MLVNFFKSNLRRIVKQNMVYNLGDSLSLGEDDLLVKETAYQFSSEMLLPNANKWDEESYFPVELIKRITFIIS